MRFDLVRDGDVWELHRRKPEHWSCCDCGLVHQLRFSLDARRRVFVTVQRMPELTAQRRRSMRLRKGERR